MSKRNEKLRKPVEALEPRLLFTNTFTPVPAHHAVVYDGHRSMAYFFDEQSMLQRYDVSAKRLLEPWPVGFTSHAADISPDGESLYAVGHWSSDDPHTMHRVDLDTGAVESTPMEFPTQGSASELAVTADGQVLFAMSHTYSSASYPTGISLRWFDPADQAVSEPLEPPTAGLVDPRITQVRFSRTPDGERLLVSWMPETSFSGYATVFDGASQELISTSGERLAWAPSALSPDGSTVAGNLDVYDVQFNVQHTLPAEPGTQLTGGVFDPVRPLFYRPVAGGAVEVYDTASWSRTSTIPLEGLPARGLRFFDALAPTADGQQLLCFSSAGVLAIPLTATPTIEGLPDHVRRGVPYPITVTMRHPLLGIDTGYTGAVHFSSDNAAVALPADYTFTPEDAGAHTFTVTFGAAGKASLAVAELGADLDRHERAGITVDGNAPAAVLKSETPLESRRKGKTFEVEFTDDLGLDPATLGDGALVVTGPDGVRHPARSEPRNNPGGATWSRRLYTFDPPGGSWDAADSGAYVVSLATGGVTDRAGNPVPDVTLTNFRIDIDSRGVGFIVGPDLDATLAPGGVGPSQIGKTEITPTLVLTNYGNEPIKTTARVYVRMVEGDGTAYGRQHATVGFLEPRLNLRPGASKSFKLPLELPDLPVGTYHFLVESHLMHLPVGGHERDRDNNNVKSTPFQLAAPKAVLLSSGPAEPLPLTPGRRASVKFTVRNDGNVPATGTLDLSVNALLTPANATDGVSQSSGRLTSQYKKIKLNPSQRKTFTFSFTMPARPPGSYYLWLTGDNNDYLGADLLPEPGTRTTP